MNFIVSQWLAKVRSDMARTRHVETQEQAHIDVLSAQTAASAPSALRETIDQLKQSLVVLTNERDQLKARVDAREAESSTRDFRELDEQLKRCEAAFAGICHRTIVEASELLNKNLAGMSPRELELELKRNSVAGEWRKKISESAASAVNQVQSIESMRGKAAELEGGIRQLNEDAAVVRSRLVHHGVVESVLAALDRMPAQDARQFVADFIKPKLALAKAEAPHEFSLDVLGVLDNC